MEPYVRAETEHDGTRAETRFGFPAKRTSPFISAGCQFSRLLAAEECGSAVVMLDRPCPIQCTTAGYPLHSPFSPSFLHPCVSVCHHILFLLLPSAVMEESELTTHFWLLHDSGRYTVQSVPDAVTTVYSSCWWWMKRSPETCRAVCRE